MLTELNQNETVTSEDNSTGIELRDKVKSKMEVAKFFSGFISLLIGFSIKDLPDILKDGPETFYIIWVGTALIFTSLILSIFTIFAYDRLQMPKLFLDPEITKKQLNLEIYNYMSRAWTRLFVPSVLCLVVGIILMFTTILLQSKIASFKTITVLLFFLVLIATSYKLYISNKIPFKNERKK